MKKSMLMVALLVGLSVQAERYVRYDHIITTGGQWINTRYRPAATDKLEIKMKFNSVSGNPFIWCSRTGGNNSYSLVSVGGGNNFRVDHGPTTAQQLGVNNKTVKPTAGTLYTIICDGAAGNISFNGTVVSGVHTTAYTPDGFLSLFASPSSVASSALTDGAAMTNFVNGEFYYFRVYNAEGELVREFVPARDLDRAAGSEFGILELVTGAFLPLNGSAGATFQAAHLRAEGMLYRTVEMKSFTGEEGMAVVNLGFTNPGLPHRLFLASGATDAGTKTNGWDNVVELPAVGALEIERTVQVAANANYYRFFVCPSLPDGATSVRYVRSTNGGNQYIDTGVPLDSDSGATLDFFYFGHHSIAFPGVFGARKDGNAQYWVFDNGGNSWTARFGNGTNRDAAKGKPGMNTRHVFELGGANWQFDDWTVAVGNATFNTERNAYLCAMNEAGTAINFADMGIYSLAMYSSGSLVRMGMPCKKADGTPALYDLVSGTYLQNGAATPLQTSDEQWSASEVLDATDPTKAVWTGLGEAGNVANPANWSCSNDFGQTVPDVVPGAKTAITLGGNLAFDIPANSALVYKSIRFENVVLASNADLSGLVASKVAAGSSIEMDGHDLKLTDLGFDGRITNGGDETRPVSEGGVVTSPTTFYVGKAANLFHNNYSFYANDTHRVLVKNENLPMVAVYDFGADGARTIIAYRVFSSPDTARSPKQWKLSGSNDNANWTELDAHAGVEDWYPLEVRRCEVAAPASYRYYRFEATDPILTGNYVQLVQLELYAEEKPLAVLELTVPAGKTVTNSRTGISGNLKLVKKGTGTFVPAKEYQDYVGGTQILEGSIKADPTPGGSRTPLGGDAELVVEAGAAFDFNNCGIWTANRFVFNGGSILNSHTGAGMGAGTDCICSLRLTADSFFAATNTIGGFGGGNYRATVDLGGHTLELLEGTNAQFNQCLVTNGTIAGAGRVTFYTSHDGWYGPEYRQFVDVTLNVSGALSVYHDAQVDTFVLPADFGEFFENGTIWVGARANLAADNFPSVKLLDGATLDFSGRTNTLSTASSTENHFLSFADNAGIVVEPGTCTLEGDVVQLLDWPDDGAPENLDGLLFDLAPEWKQHWSLRVRDDGIYLIRKLGAVIYIR